jgi:hypothetical protein
MNKAGAALLLVLFVDVFLFFGQLGMDEVNPGNAPTIIDLPDSTIGKFDAGNHTVKSFDMKDLPGGGASVDSGGSLWTDVFGTLLDWLMSIPGVKTALQIINAVPRTLSLIFPNAQAIVFAFGALWHCFVLFMFIEWLRG